MKTYYGGLIWTNHALSRLTDRGLSQEKAWEAFNNPDSSQKGKTSGSIEFRKKIEHSHVTLIAKQNERREWIVISAWVDPPFPGSKDAREKASNKKYQKASFWGKFFHIVKKQLGF